MAPWSVSVLIREELVHETGEPEVVLPGYAFVLFHLRTSDWRLLIGSYTRTHEVLVAVEVDGERPNTDVVAIAFTKTRSWSCEKSRS